MERTTLVSRIYEKYGGHYIALQLYCYRCGGELDATVYVPPVYPFEDVWGREPMPLPPSMTTVECPVCGFCLYDQRAQYELQAAYDEVMR